MEVVFSVWAQIWIRSAVTRNPGNMPGNHHRSGWTLLAGIGTLLLLLGGVLGHKSSIPVSAQELSSIALVQAAGGTVAINGGSVSLPLLVSDTTDLGAATIVVQYDPSLLSPTACRPSSTFDVSLCNLAYDVDLDGVADGVRFNVISIAGVTVGISPTLALAEIVWTTTQTATLGGSSALSVTVNTFTDTSGRPMAVTAQSGLIRFTPEVIATPTPAILYLPSIQQRRDAHEITPTPVSRYLPFP